MMRIGQKLKSGKNHTDDRNFSDSELHEPSNLPDF